ncbi:uncharacterized protein F5147DRAFT_671453 [Suillus discolor]|uniref:Uncharacterized protein n=1 Tax=Suillus discolor TaxID=1912936 RepID=A0A9P7JYK9_9AGAM|nr:uncharacterized protein F5147DRAFT_671453 [Suillus discolor]KAG2117154.1 hypothetical protein F5147DRAFT_671453 [Suillus discolor]
MVETQKTLSTGTLNLRFMQNARRAQQLSGVDVELEKAHVKDEAEWEVAPDIRKAWGLVDGSNSDSNDDLYERSYVPFLFPSVSETSGEDNGPSSSSTSFGGMKPQGRRKFTKNGEESFKPPEVRPAATTVADVQPDEKRKTKIKSISSSTHSSTSAKPLKKLKEPASRVIYDNSSVGVDLRSSLSSNRTSTASVPKSTVTSDSKAFMKPAGVDDPSITPASRDAPSASASASFARKGKRRREQDNAEVETAGLKKKTLSFVE